MFAPSGQSYDPSGQTSSVPSAPVQPSASDQDVHMSSEDTKSVTASAAAPGPEAEGHADPSAEELSSVKTDRGPPETSSKPERKVLKTSEASTKRQESEKSKGGTMASAPTSASGRSDLKPVNSEDLAIAAAIELFSSLPNGS